MQQERAIAGLSINLLTLMIAYPFPTPVKFICQPYPYLKQSQSTHVFGIAKMKKSNNTQNWSWDFLLQKPGIKDWLVSF